MKILNRWKESSTYDKAEILVWGLAVLMAAFAAGGIVHSIVVLATEL